MTAIKPYKIHIQNSELDLLHRKLELTRLSDNNSCGEDNGVTAELMRDTVHFWLTKYDWHAEEAKLNNMPQFTTFVDADDFGDLEIHFVHSKTSARDTVIPLLFLHGWPGSFLEVQRLLPLLNHAGFDVVAPSLPGYGFSSYPTKAGFKHKHHARTLHKLMVRLGYDQYAVQGGDWGSDIARTMGRMFPTHIRALHQNMLMMAKPDFAGGEPAYFHFERKCLERFAWFQNTNPAYDSIQSTKPNALGYAMHDSPVAMLAWMVDKLFSWSDEYPWTPTEIIAWTLLHWFPGPTTGFLMYFENNPSELMKPSSEVLGYLETPTGYSAFPKELAIMPRLWAETIGNVVFWQNHTRGGQFAAYERPQELAGDVIRFVREAWKTGAV